MRREGRKQQRKTRVVEQFGGLDRISRTVPVASIQLLFQLASLLRREKEDTAMTLYMIEVEGKPVVILTAADRQEVERIEEDLTALEDGNRQSRLRRHKRVVRT